MTIGFVQSVSSSPGTGTSFPLAYNTPNTTGDFLYCGVFLQAAATTCTVADSNGNVWTEIDHRDQGSFSLWNFYAKNCAGGANTVTVTQGTSAVMRIILAEYSGVDIASPIDVFSQQSNGSSSAISVGPMTTTFDNPLLLSLNRWTPTQTFTPGTNYTTRESLPASVVFALQDFISSDVAGSETATATLGGLAAWEGLFTAVKPQQGTTPSIVIPNTTYRIYEYLYTC